MNAGSNDDDEYDDDQVCGLRHINIKVDGNDARVWVLCAMEQWLAVGSNKLDTLKNIHHVKWLQFYDIPNLV